MSDKTCNAFEQLSKINVNEHIEKKGGFSYLSWPFAVSELRKHHPEATWEVKRFNNLPYLQTPLGYLVEVEVIVNGIAMSQIHPVLDNRNQVIKEPNVFHINTSIQRCLVKAIALHGLGLYIYAGEDLPIDEEPQETNKKPVQSVPAQQVTQPQAKKETYVSKAVKQVLEAEKTGKQFPIQEGGPNIDELKEIFGDDIVVVEETCLSEEQAKVVVKKINATGAFNENKDVMKENYSNLYKLIRDELGINVKKRDDIPFIHADDFDRLVKWLDSKKDCYKRAA